MRRQLQKLTPTRFTAESRDGRERQDAILAGSGLALMAQAKRLDSPSENQIP
jgi:hypothetical protein